MSWSCTRNHSLGIVEVLYEGETSARDLQDSTTECIEMEKLEGLNRFLVDVAEMTIAPRTSLFDILQIPASQYEVEQADRNGRVAVVAPETSKVLELARFYETACVNRGWQAKVFSGHEEAVNWLTQEHSTQELPRFGT